MRETRPSGSEGGEAELNRPSLPLSLRGPDYLDDPGDYGRGLFDSLIFDDEMLDALANGARRRQRR